MAIQVGAMTEAVKRAIAESDKDARETERRLRHVIRSAEPNDGRKFPHWFGNGWFVLVRKSKAELWHSCHYDARKASKIMEGSRTAATYAAFAQAMGL